MLTASEILSVALGHQMAGRLAEAAQAYQRLIALEPNNALAWHLLGVIAQQLGHHEVAVGLIRRSLAISPDYAEAHHDLGDALRAQEKLDEAAACYRRALELEPDRIDANYNLAGVLLDQGKLQEALAAYSRTLELMPDHAEAHNALGCCLMKLRRLDRATACFQRAADLKTDSAGAHHNLGAALLEAGNVDQAIAAFRQALHLMPDSVEAQIGLGAAMQMNGDSERAILCYESALHAQPDRADAHNNLGNAFKDQGRLQDAIASYRRALALNPGYLSAYSNFLYALYFYSDYDAATIYEEHRRWSDLHALPFAKSIQPHSNERSPHRRLRIGYVSLDFCNHCQSFFTAPLFVSHNPEQVEIFCYSDVASPDATTARLRSTVENWRDITGLADEQLAQAVREDAIDVLVDLTMHMSNGRPLLFARKPAPVQVCWLAYPGTTGQSAIDYRLTDPYLDPPGVSDRYYSEASVWLPDSFWCYDPVGIDLPVRNLPATDNGYVTFGSLNNFCKVNAEVIKAWASVLRSIPASRLVLLAPEGSHRAHTAGLFEQEGVASERIKFVGKQSLPRYFELYHQIDIGLDTFPYNGHTTSLDAYWMGVPVVTITGQTAVGRAGVSQLTNLGLPELIADPADQFAQVATALASDLDRLSHLRQTLRERMRHSSLTDATRFARNMETALRNMWERWCAN